MDQNTDEDASFNFTVPANTFSDPDVGDTLTFSATLSDGSALPHWLLFDAATQTFSGLPENQDVGILDVIVTATDNDGLSVSDTFLLTINNTNDAPVVGNALVDQITVEDSNFNFMLPANTFSDPDVGDALTFSAILSDGSALPDWLLFDAATQTFSGTPDNQDVGNLNVRVIATDSSNISVSDDFILTVEANNPPDEFNIIEGNGRGNILFGTNQADQIFGRGAADIIHGFGGDDELIGGGGSDYLVGGLGDDLVRGGNGNDYLDGADGDDTLRGGNGHDVLYGGNGNDLLKGGAGFDVLYGGNDNDRLEGGANNDLLFGQNGNDILEGSAGNDELYGGQGSDTYIINRGDGYDYLQETAHPNAGDIDQIQYGENITTSDIWFVRNDSHLDIYTLGSNDRVQIENWYSQPRQRIEEFHTQSGAVLFDEDVQALVNAMASFGAPVNGEINLSSQEQQQIQDVIAASWQ